MHITPQRIAADIQMCSDQNLAETEGIYVLSDVDNAHCAKIMMIGPSETPYANGFYFFELRFPANYPFSPPVVKLITQGNGVRFNPNFYTNGRVCVSILNTWKGPQWTSCQNLRSVLLSLRTLMVENPLVNEPGWESGRSPEHRTYARIVAMENVRTAILGMLTDTPGGYECFRAHMAAHFLKHYNEIQETTTKMCLLNPSASFYCSVYNMRVEFDMQDLVLNLNALYSKVNSNTGNAEAAAEAAAVTRTKRSVSQSTPKIRARDFAMEHGAHATHVHNGKVFTAVADARGYYRWRVQKNAEGEP